MQSEIKHTWYFTQSPQQVWQYLTQPALIEQWMMKTDLQPVAGQKFHLYSPWREDDVADCEVLEVNPFTTLSFSWLAHSGDHSRNFNTKVVWTLSPLGSGTELLLTHRGFTVLEDFTAYNNGWLILVSQLTELLKKVESGSYTSTIELESPPNVVFNHLKDVSKWWGGKDFEGSSSKTNDEFIIRHGDVHYSKQKLVEVVSDKKIVWLVTESKLNWLERDKDEWTNTKMIFEITPQDGKTLLHFTHEGLVPGKECYERCRQGWNMVISDWLYNFITKGVTILK